MNSRAIVLAGLALIGASAAAANADLPTYTLDWKVNGQESVVVNEGDVVLVTATANWGPPTHGLGSNMMRVELANSDATDAYQYSEAMGLGRNPLLRLTPQSFINNAIPGGWTITGAGNTTIDSAQLPQFINPLYTPANPIEVFRFLFTAGAAGRTIDIDSPLSGVNLYADAMGTPVPPYILGVDGAQIQIVPAPGAMALLGLGGALCVRRRRGN
jgi:hypothetical protein